MKVLPIDPLQDLPGCLTPCEWGGYHSLLTNSIICEIISLDVLLILLSRIIMTAMLINIKSSNIKVEANFTKLSRSSNRIVVHIKADVINIET